MVHILCVPVITWTVLVWLNHVPALLAFDLLSLSSEEEKATHVVLLLYIGYYLLLEPVAGVVFWGCFLW
jgi:uncharacterized membrane protein YGL010W